MPMLHRDVTADGPTAEPGQWLTQAELASRSGRSIAAVRSWVRRRREQGLLRTQRSNRGETQVWTTPDLLTELGQASDVADDIPAAVLADEFGELRHMLAAPKVSWRQS